MAEALERDAHTIGEWLAVFCERGPSGLTFEHLVQVCDMIRSLSDEARMMTPSEPEA